MVPHIRPLLATITVIASLGSGRLLAAQASDTDEVRRVIQAETDTYYRRDA